MIMDSRGKNLQHVLIRMKINATVEILKGYKLEEAVSMIMLKPLKDIPDVITVGSGICNITKMIRNPRQVVLANEDIKSVVLNYNKAMWSAYNEIRLTYPRAKVNFATIYGLDLADYNHPGYSLQTPIQRTAYNDAKLRHAQQDILDNIIQAVNIEIQKMNTNLGITTAWTGNCIHKYYQNRYHNNYSKLIDGCHPNEVALEGYASQIAKAFKKIVV